jgi:acyl-[acyl-carrier-protein]-phospholipid O-acyltransferase/long-chain-fatty-acid--[acyl-carrier-protein] ligase
MRRWVQTVVRWGMRVLFRVSVHGPLPTERAVIVANHRSLLDALLLYAWMPGPLVFAISRVAANKPIVKWATRLAALKYVVLDSGNAFSIRELLHILQENPHMNAIVFPEGRLSSTGFMMKVYEGAAVIADKLKLPLVPVYVDGAERYTLAEVRARVPRCWFPSLTATVFPPLQLKVSPELHGAARRSALHGQLQQLMAHVAFAAQNRAQTLPQVLNGAISRFGVNRLVMMDCDTRVQRSYGYLTRLSRWLGQEIAAITRPGEWVGVHLPPSEALLGTLFGLWAEGRVPVVLADPSASLPGLRVLVTQHPVASTLPTDLRVYQVNNHPHWNRWRANRAQRPLPKGAHPEDPALVLPSEGAVWSHAQLVRQLHQFQAVAALDLEDTVMSVTPVHQGLGLLLGTLFPLLSGIRVCWMAHPNHARLVSEQIYHTDTSILVASSSTVSAMMELATRYDLYRLRMVFTPPHPSLIHTAKRWQHRFGIPLLPVFSLGGALLSLNTLLASKQGTVGQWLPGLTYRLRSEPGVPHGGRLVVKGAILGAPVAAGQILPVSTPVEGPGWWDTGQVVRVDSNGWVTWLHLGNTAKPLLQPPFTTSDPPR